MRYLSASMIVLVLSIGTAMAAGQPRPLPSIPAAPPQMPSPQLAANMLAGLSDPMLKAALAQPSIRDRAEVVLNLEGCDWRVRPNDLAQMPARSTAAYLTRLSTPDLRKALFDPRLLNRIDALFDRDRCAIAPPPDPPMPDLTQRGDQNSDPGPYPYPYGYPQGDYGRDPYNGPRPAPVPGVPYGGPYGGYGSPYNW